MVNQDKIELDIVKFNWEGDGVTALYINGGLYTYGDYYHNKINEWLDGFIKGLEYCGKTIRETIHYMSFEDDYNLVEDIVDMANSPPDLLSSFVDRCSNN